MAGKSGRAGSGRKANTKGFPRDWTRETCTRVQSALGQLRTPLIRKSFTMGKWDTNHLKNLLSNLKTLTFDERSNLKDTIACILLTFPTFFKDPEAIPGHWAADIRQSVINKYKNSMDTFLDSMKTKGAADLPTWDTIFATELQAPPLAAPMPPPVPLPRLDAPLVNRKRARSDFTNDSNLSRDETNELRQLHQEIVSIQSEEEALEEDMTQREVQQVADRRALRKLRKRKKTAIEAADAIWRKSS